jgi:hypothetical protein
VNFISLVIAVDRFELLENWEFYSGRKLSEEERRKFLKECRHLLHFDNKILRNALRIIRKYDQFGEDRDFAFRKIELIASQLREQTKVPVEQPKTKNWTFSRVNLTGLSSDSYSYIYHREKRRRR